MKFELKRLDFKPNFGSFGLSKVINYFKMANYLKFDYRIQYAYLCGTLDPETQKLIPKSTLRNWKNKGLEHIIGLSFDETQLIERELEVLKILSKHKRLLKVFKRIIPVYQTMEEIFKSIPNKNKILKPFHHQLVDVISNSSQACSS